jgi:hypothetical protein
MGYRSNLFVKLPKEKLFELKQLFTKADVLDDSSFFSDLEIEIDNHYLYIKIEDLKWYDPYPDVAIINSFMHKQEKGGMIRIGEEADDIETYGCPWNSDLYTVTNIKGFI